MTTDDGMRGRCVDVVLLSNRAMRFTSAALQDVAEYLPVRLWRPNPADVTCPNLHLVFFCFGRGRVAAGAVSLAGDDWFELFFALLTPYGTVQLEVVLVNTSSPALPDTQPAKESVLTSACAVAAASPYQRSKLLPPAHHPAKGKRRRQRIS